jgi:hypothetical protein
VFLKRAFPAVAFLLLVALVFAAFENRKPKTALAAAD